jgi:hypothetical protein
MKKIILTIMIMSSCQINAYQKRLSSLWIPVSHATQIGFRAPASVIRTMATSSPVEVQEAFKNPTLWQKFRGWFSKKPVNITPANITIEKPFIAIESELETVKKLVKAPRLATREEVLAAAVKNVENYLSFYNNLVPNDIVEQMKNEAEQRLLRRLKQDIEEIAYEIELDKMIELEIFHKGGVSITKNAYNIEIAREAIADLYYFNKPNFDIKMSEIDLRNKINQLHDKIINAERDAQMYGYNWVDKIAPLWPIMDNLFLGARDKYFIREIVTKYLCGRWINQLQDALTALQEDQKSL